MQHKANPVTPHRPVAGFFNVSKGSFGLFVDEGLDFLDISFGLGGIRFNIFLRPIQKIVIIPGVTHILQACKQGAVFSGKNTASDIMLSDHANGTFVGLGCVTRAVGFLSRRQGFRAKRPFLPGGCASTLEARFLAWRGENVLEAGFWPWGEARKCLPVAQSVLQLLKHAGAARQQFAYCRLGCQKPFYGTLAAGAARELPARFLGILSYFFVFLQHIRKYMISIVACYISVFVRR